MDVERTMEFILAQQAKLAESQFKADQRAARAEQRMDRADRQVQAIRKLVQTGMKLVIQIAAAQKKTAALVAAHEERLARTEANIERMLAALTRQRHNGRR
jgi:uncharacterized radical SAM superfamily Fe-S cluster-containing enzyme